MAAAVPQGFVIKLHADGIDEAHAEELPPELRERAVRLVHKDHQEAPGLSQQPVESTQFRSRKFAHSPNRHGPLGSMDKVGAAGDNTAMEPFSSLIQKNVLNNQRWATREALRLAAVSWTEGAYHRRLRQAALGTLTPVEFEAIMKPALALVAWTKTVTYPCSRPAPTPTPHQSPDPPPHSRTARCGYPSFTKPGK